MVVGDVGVHSGTCGTLASTVGTVERCSVVRSKHCPGVEVIKFDTLYIHIVEKKVQVTT